MSGVNAVVCPTNYSNIDAESTANINDSRNITANNAVANTDNEAASSTPNTVNILCRYFAQGICRFGPRCRFSHDLNDNQRAGASEEIPTTSATSNYKAKQNNIENWINAPVFVPRGLNIETKPTILNEMTNIANGLSATKIDANNENMNENANNDINGAFAPNLSFIKPAPTWASILGGGTTNNVGVTDGTGMAGAMGVTEICPFEGPCPHGIYCSYPIHLELCKMCDQYCLHPHDADQRRKHNKECLQQHEQAMELSFAIARSKDKTCGICFDTIMEKSGREKRFGILPNCSHIFCLECIRKWRQAKQFEHKITRSCPECRISSDFVCPSAFWVETKEEKDKLLSDYRVALGIKDCKYFKKGDGRCPFGNKCFYKHALPNGDLVDVGLPKRSRKVHRSSSDSTDLLAIYLWEYVDHRDFYWYDVITNDTSDDDDDDDDEDQVSFEFSDVSEFSERDGWI